MGVHETGGCFDRAFHVRGVIGRDHMGIREITQEDTKPDPGTCIKSVRLSSDFHIQTVTGACAYMHTSMCAHTQRSYTIMTS